MGSYGVLLLLGAAACAQASESDALAISANIQARHLPYGTVLDPVLSPVGAVMSFSRCGDSAVWTGHYLAAEAFRYTVTGSAEARANAGRALEGIESLINATGTGLLARCAFPSDSPWAAAISSEEAHNGIHTADGITWVGHTSRDQYSGAMFGLAAAYDMVPDLRGEAARVITRLLDFLLAHQWAVVMPDRTVSTAFIGRPDQQLAFLQIGRHVNPGRFDSAYQIMRARYAMWVPAPVGIEALDEYGSYFKFNLDAINLYSLIRLEESGPAKFWYRRAYDGFRGVTEGHANAHFSMMDRALRGADERRDAETRALLDGWLERPRLNPWVDWRGRVPECGDRACTPLPVSARVPTDFLWQRSPFQLYGGGNGDLEGAGIDYILPYWLARYYGVIE